MVRRDGGAGEPVRFPHVLGGLTRGDVLKHNFQLGKVAAQWNQLGVDEHGFAVKQVNVRAGHLAMHQQQQARALHGFQCFVGFAQVSHTGIAVGGSPGGVQLDGHHTCICGALDFVGRQVVGEIKRHQRLKHHAGRHSSPDALRIGQGLHGRGDWRLQVGHDDGAAELGGGVRHHRDQRIAIAYVQVPVVRAGNRQRGNRSGCGGGDISHSSYCPKSLAALGHLSAAQNGTWSVGNFQKSRSK